MGTLVMVGQLILSLSILIVLHEGGHFLPAKLFGTRVEKFYLFFDPYFSLFKFKIIESEIISISSIASLKTAVLSSIEPVKSSLGTF